ncbi:protein GlxC [Rhodovibrionaceae bacterium A322]
MSTELDLKTSDLTTVNRTIRGLEGPESAAETDWHVVNPLGTHSIAVGLTEPINVTVEGHAGFYCGGMNKEANIVIKGHAGPGVAENMMSGSVRVTGNASQFAGATAHGGLLVIEGDAAARCGISMKGVDIVVKGSVGHMCGFLGQKGNVVICGDAGHDLGDSVYEANLFVKGKVDSLGADCVEKEMRPEHLETITRLLAEAGVEADAKDFKRYGSARNLYNFNIDNVDAM